MMIDTHQRTLDGQVVVCTCGDRNCASLDYPTSTFPLQHGDCGSQIRRHLNITGPTGARYAEPSDRGLCVGCGQVFTIGPDFIRHLDADELLFWSDADDDTAAVLYLEYVIT